MPPVLISRYRLEELLREYNISFTLEGETALSPLEAFVASVYSVLFLCGIGSNIWVLLVIGVVSRGTWTGYTNVLFYTGSLTCVNLLVLFSIPATLADLTYGHWTLPEAVCPLYWTVEMLNKVASSLIVASIAITCCFAVCRPHCSFMYKNRLVAVGHLVLTSICVGWQSYRIWPNSEVFDIVDDSENHTFILYTRKCLYEPGDHADRTQFAVSAFLTGYGIPALVMVSCYLAILRTVYKRSRSIVGRGMEQFNQVAKSSSILVIFYLLTWTPYWCATMILNSSREYSSVHDAVGMVAFFFHTLPLANSAFSTLIYTLLNRTLREQYRMKVEERKALKKENRTNTTYV